MKLKELHESSYKDSKHHKLSYEGYKLRQDVQLEDDNAKVLHYITPAGGKEISVDHDPYEDMSQAAFEAQVKFYKDWGRFIDRKDLKSKSPPSNETIKTFSKKKYFHND